MLLESKALDLTDERGILCGCVLAQLGCEVIAIEPPGGSPVRRLAPYLKDDPDRGLWWEAYARGKESLELAVDTPDGRERLLELVSEADFLIECWTEAEARALRLVYETLAAVNPQLIVVSITPFGRTGPKADWPATDLTVWAAGGAHALTGDAERAPVRTSVPQAFLHAGADAVGGALIAHYERSRSGLGQLVDVSAQQSATLATIGSILATPNSTGFEMQREGGGMRGLFPLRLVWPASDGYIVICFMFGPAFNEPNRKLLSWVKEAGYCSQQEVDTEWGVQIAAMLGAEQSPEPYFEVCEKVERFTSVHTCEYLYEEAIRRGVYIVPCYDMQGLVDELHFNGREYWDSLSPVGTDATGKVPGAFARFSSTSLKSLEPAPVLGDIVESALEPVTVTANDREKQPGREEGSNEVRDLPLAGLKVLDFMWVYAGAIFTRTLSDFGATVIKVESSVRLDPGRAGVPFVNGETTVNGSAPFNSYNADKLGVTIDLNNPAGREIIHDLVRWADVVTESYSPKAMPGWGLDYESLKQVNPSLIMLSSCLMGQTGPRAMMPGYGNMAASLAGFYDTTGWRDLSPAGPYQAYTDAIAPRFMLIALLAALEHRRRTGDGQYVDVSQAEAAIQFLAPAILDYELNGHVWSRNGNRDLNYAPHGVYPTRGDDQWIAISCASDAIWEELCQVMSLTGEAENPALQTAAGRLVVQDELDAKIAAWTQTRDGVELQNQLIGAGVAAHVVQNSTACSQDPQLAHRNHFQTVPHTGLGPVVVEGPRCALSRTPGRVIHAGPDLGEHCYVVLKEILNYDDEQIAEAFASQIME